MGATLAGVVVEAIEDAPQLPTQDFDQPLCNFCFIELAKIGDVRADSFEGPRDGFGEDEIVEPAGEGHREKH